MIMLCTTLSHSSRVWPAFVTRASSWQTAQAPSTTGFPAPFGNAFWPEAGAASTTAAAGSKDRSAVFLMGTSWRRTIVGETNLAEPATPLNPPCQDRPEPEGLAGGWPAG